MCPINKTLTSLRKYVLSTFMINKPGPGLNIKVCSKSWDYVHKSECESAICAGMYVTEGSASCWGSSCFALSYVLNK